MYTMAFRLKCPQIFCTVTASDPDNDALSYKWSFGDGSTINGRQAFHEYQSVGTYSVFVTVDDGNDHVAVSDSQTVQIGSPPVLTVTSPVDQSSFSAGQPITYSAVATQGGTGNNLPNSAFSWNIRFKHDNHTHPVGNNLPGKKGSFNIPVSGHTFAGDTGFEIEVTVNDASTGLSTTKMVFIKPKKSLAVVKSNPCGVTIVMNDLPVKAKCNSGYQEDSLQGFQHSAEAPATVCLGGLKYNFAQWTTSGGGTVSSQAPSATLTVSSGSQTQFTAVYTQASTCGDSLPTQGEVC